MKTLSAQVCPRPELSQTQIQRLGNTISGFIEQIEESRKDRVCLILNFRKEYQDDFAHRQEAGTVFQYSNISVPILKGTCASMAAKFEDEIWNGEKPFIVKPQGIEDRVAAEKQEKYWNWELKQCGIEDTGSALCDVLVSEGTAITKRGWRYRASYYSRFERRLVGPDGNDLMFEGKPVLANHPTRIEQQTRFVDGQQVTDEVHMLEGLEIPNDPNQISIREAQVKEAIVHEDRLESVLVPFEDFLCLETVAKIEDSPLLGHAYELKLWQLYERILQTPQDGWLIDEVINTFQAAGKGTEEETDQHPGDKEKKITGALAPMRHFGEKAAKLSGLVENSDQYKTAKLVECYLKYDLDEDGYVEDLVVIFDRNTKKPIWVDFMVNVYADCKNPFTVYGLYRVQNRWYSLGVLEFMKLAQKFVDTVFNRMNYRTAMNANPLQWFKRNRFLKLPKTWGPGGRAELKDDANPADSMGFWAMPALESTEWQFFNFFVSLIQLVTGVTTAAQGDVSNLPSTSTATGISSIIEEGNKLFRKSIARIKRSLKDDLVGMVKLNQQNLNVERVFRYMKGSEEIVQVIRPEDIRDLDYDVEIVPTKYSPQIRLNAMKVALDVVNSFLAIPVPMQIRMRPIFADLLAANGIVEAEEVLPSIAELQQDQEKDSVLEEIAGRIQQVAASIAVNNVDPTKQAQQDLIGIAQILQQIKAQPPEKQAQIGAGGAMEPKGLLPNTPAPAGQQMPMAA